MYGSRTPSIGSTNAVKMKTSVSGVFLAISVQNAAKPRSAATGEIRIAAMSVPRMSEQHAGDDQQQERHTEAREERRHE